MYFFVTLCLFTLFAQPICALGPPPKRDVSQTFIDMDQTMSTVIYTPEKHLNVLKKLEAFVVLYEVMKTPRLRINLQQKIDEIVDIDYLWALIEVCVDNANDISSLPIKLRDEKILSEAESTKLQIIIKDMYLCIKKLNFLNDPEHRTFYYLSYKKFEDYMARVAFKKYSELNPNDHIESDYYLSKEQINPLDYMVFARWYKVNAMRIRFLKFLIKQYNLESSLSLFLLKKVSVPTKILN